jgi:hypothetical protein
MKRKAKSIREHLPPVKLYLEDIRDIWHLFGDVAEDVTLETENYAVTDIADLDRIPEKSTTILNMSCHRPFHIALDFRPYEATLYSSSDVPAAVGALYKLRDRIKRNSNWLINIISRYSTVWIIIIISWLIGALDLSASDQRVSNMLGIINNVVMVLISILIALTMWIRLRGYSKIMFYSREQAGFWGKHRDQIIIGIIVATVGTFLANLLWNFSGGFVLLTRP